MNFKKIFFVIFFNIFFLHGSAQKQIHVKYYHVRSQIATVYEDLYVRNENVISIQDSIVNFNNTSNEVSAVRKTSKPNSKNYFISNISSNKNIKDIFFTALNLETKYFVHDLVEKPDWNIDEKKTKKILGYNCIQATTNFRGTKLIAYFTKELPYSVGPFKFYGLPGVILDIREDNKNFNIWKAEKVELSVPNSINFTPKLDTYPKIGMREFIEMKEGRQAKEQAEILSKMPQGTKIQTDAPKNRYGIEKKFEWEN